jgi:hypothetical protein
VGNQGGLTVNEAGQVPARLPSEDVIISAPMSYAGSAQRIMRIRRRAQNDSALAWLTTLAVALVVVAWVSVTVWYLMWGLLLVPYRLLRRGARKRHAEALRHRELLAAIAGGEVGSSQRPSPPPEPPPTQRIGDAEREQTIEELRGHMLAGRLTHEEFEHRVGAVHAARTRGEIVAVSSDLPVSTSGSTPS